MSRRKKFTRNLGRELAVPLPVRTTSEWVRFEHEHEPYGVFSYISDAEELLATEGMNQLNELRGWFNEHLDAPESLTKERFWFCAEAVHYVEKARQLSQVLRSVGIPIVERRTKRVPGKVRWHDANQVAVVTYRDTPQSTKRAP
jgi:hypothetical protein